MCNSTDSAAKRLVTTMGAHNYQPGASLRSRPESVLHPVPVSGGLSSMTTTATRSPLSTCNSSGGGGSGGGGSEEDDSLEQEMAKRPPPPANAQPLNSASLAGELVKAANYDVAYPSIASYDPQFIGRFLGSERNSQLALEPQYARFTMGTQGSRLQVPALNAYLGALIAQDRLSGPRAFTDAAAWRLTAAESTDGGLKLPALAYLAPLTGEHQFSAMLGTEKSGRSSSESGGGGVASDKNITHVIHLMAIVVALLGAYLAVKLVMRSAGNQYVRRRFGRLNSESGSQSDTVVGTASKQMDLKEANMLADNNRRSLNETTDGFDHHHHHLKSSSSDKSCNLDQLTQRLASLLNHRPFGKARESPPPCYEEANDRKELDEASTLEEPPGSNESNFRSSGSYIRSLIDVLSKARAQINSGSRSGNVDPDELSSLADEEISRSTNMAAASDDVMGGSEKSASPLTSKQADAGIVMSQMDITAAHLILAYMEKHLEDKERLRREWLELNAGPTRGTNAKIVHLMLQKLAKVALGDENRYKNRNPLVVPFDRNRVKLTSSASSPPSVHQPRAAGATAAASSSSSNNKLGPNGRQHGRKPELPPPPPLKGSDYINASYIYDDDLRNPTHIITQGPSEHTSGQFWQMVWEQGISVIVMLTRLNENSNKMCHCYWPTNSSQEFASGGSAADADHLSGASEPTATRTSGLDDTNGMSPGEGSSKKTAAGPQLASGRSANNGNDATGQPTTANGRRVSVTSVFNTVGARLNPNGQPIIANGDLSNNILFFDVAFVAAATSAGQSAPTTTGESAASSDGNGETSGDGSGGKRASLVEANQKQTTIVTRFEVHLVSEHVSSNDYLVRNMYIINRSTGETRTITQFHYLSWPENGVPDNVKSFLQFRRKVHKSYRNLKSPILVHCSDGGGRSGTYTLIDIILERIRNGAKEIDPRATLEHLRDQRVGLCATQSQFEFVLVALAEEIQIILNALPQ